MRPIFALAAALVLAPAAALAQQDRPPPPPPRAYSPAPAPSRAAPAPAYRGARPRSLAAPAPGRSPSGAAYAVPAPPRGRYPVPGPNGYYTYDWFPFWMGWSWGWGYYPLWPRPGYGPYDPYDPYGGYGAPAQGEAERVTTKLAFAGAGSPDGFAGGLSIAVDGRHVGFEAAADAVKAKPSGALSTGDTPALALASAHVSFSVVSSEFARVRLEIGASMLDLPTTGVYAGAPYAGNTVIGPDVGVSGHVGLFGPIGFEGHARFTPYPVAVTDLRAALALRAGPVALTGGWRGIRLDGNGTDGPDASFSGPELGLQMIF